MRRVTLGVLFTLSGIVAVAASAYAESYILNEIVLPFPGVTATSVTGLNDNGQIVGVFRDAAGVHGFLNDKHRFRKLDVPFAGSTETMPVGINNRGEVVGVYRDANGAGRGFFYDKGLFAAFDLPFATETDVLGINDSGEIAGVYANSLGIHGFLYTHRRFTTLDVPLPGVAATRAWGVNNRGQVVGQYELALPPGSPPFANPVTRGFVYDNGKFRLLDLPDFSGFIENNDKGDFVAQCTGIATCDGFFSLFSDGQFDKVALPEISDLSGIDNRGRLVGFYVDDKGQAVHGYMAEPMKGVSFVPNPSTYTTSPDTTGCPAGFVGKSTFNATLTNNNSRPALTGISLRVTTLTNGNLLQNATRYDGFTQKYTLVAEGVGATLRIPEEGAFADGFLTLGESVDVKFVVCLKTPGPFNFLTGIYAFQGGPSL